MCFVFAAPCSVISVAWCLLDPSPDPSPDTERGALVPPSSQEGG